MKAGTRREAWKVARMLLPYDIKEDKGESESGRYTAYCGVDSHGDVFQIRDYGDKLVLAPKDGAAVSIYVVDESRPVPEKGSEGAYVLVVLKDGETVTYPVDKIKSIVMHL